ncbi:hypothetical protein [Cytobacillus pseudoceanisediminis]|uniref:hypothetical protein n=1 Tax=Cytobacillus pseudoceanisediminis TaxID=3051614 RepID=UPI003C2CF7F1
MTDINTDFYTFKFFIQRIEEFGSDINEKNAFVETTAFYNNTIVYEGIIRVRFNDYGIFPFPEDLSQADIPVSVKRKMAAEMKRYIKPQKKYL